MRKSFTLNEDEKKTFYTGLGELQKKLIDTSRRNKLINYRFPPKSRFLRIIDESPDFMFKHLVEKEDKFKLPPFPVKAMEEIIGDVDSDEMPVVSQPQDNKTIENLIKQSEKTK